MVDHTFLYTSAVQKISELLHEGTLGEIYYYDSVRSRTLSRTLFFESSCVAHVSVNWLSPIKIRQTFIGGSSKMIVYDDVEPTEKIKVYDEGITLNGSPDKALQLRIGYRAGDMWAAPHIPAKEALQTEVEHFVDCMRNGKLPISSGLSGLKVVQILEAASGSIGEQGKPIGLKPMRLKLMRKEEV
jgi:predicted dehydrogenase